MGHTITREEHSRRDQLLLQEQLSEQNRDLGEAHIKSLHEIEELKRVQELRIDEFSRRRLIENQDTTNELTARIQELQNEVNCMNDSRDFKDAESVRSGLFPVPSQPALFPPHPDPGRLLSRNDKPSGIWNTHGISGNVFANPPASSSSHCPGGFNPLISYVTEDTSPHVTSERQIPDTALDPSFQSGQSARNSFDPKKGRFSKDYEADQRRLQISEFHFDKFPTPTTFACWKTTFKTEVCTCSQFPAEAMLWIKEVELVDSVDELRSSSSTRGISMPNFELLDARIASALNKIIQNTRFKRRISLEEMKAHKEDLFFRGRQIAYLIYEYFRVTGANDAVENYADLFTIALRNDDIQEFVSKWDEILLSMTQIPSDDILESLYKQRIRESEKLKTVLELCNMEIHQNKAGPDHHRLKTTVKRSIEQNLRMKKFEARNRNFETSAVIKNHWVKQREQRSPGNCWQWKANGQCPQGNNFSFRHDMNKLTKSTQPNPSPGSSTKQSVQMHREPEVLEVAAQVGKWLDCRARISSKELAQLHSVKNGILWSACCTSRKRDADLGISALTHTARLKNSPAKRSKKNGDKSAVAFLKNTRKLGCVSQDMEPPKSSSILRKSSNILKPIRFVPFTKAVLRHANTRDQNPSLGMICQMILISAIPTPQNLRIGL